MVESGTNVNNTPPTTSDVDKPGEKIKEKLVGCMVVLDPQASGMFVDESNKITLSFFKDGAEQVEFTKEMDPITILKNVKFGILRIKKGEKDVTEDFGGKASVEDWRRKPVVEGIPEKVDEKGKDKALINLLNRNKESEVIRDINSINDFAVLVRLEELEKMGTNPVAVGRSNVLDLLKKKIKSTPGIIEPTQVPEEEKDAVSVK